MSSNYPSIEDLNQSKAAPVEGMLPALAHRWSPRSFKEIPIPAADLKIILEAAQWAASSGNGQPWRFFVGVKGTETHAKIFAALVEGNQSWAGKASVLILGTTILKGPKGPTYHALYDLGQAAATMCIQATALGLITHSMAGFSHDGAMAAFELPEDYGVGAVIAIGYQDEVAALPSDNLKDREVAPRQRKPLAEIALASLDVPFTP